MVKCEGETWGLQTQRCFSSRRPEAGMIYPEQRSTVEAGQQIPSRKGRKERNGRLAFLWWKRYKSQSVNSGEEEMQLYFSLAERIIEPLF